MAQHFGQSPDRFRHLRERGEMFFRCDICGLPYPDSMMKWQDGRRVCPDNFEEGGGEISRDLDHARAAAKAAAREAGRRLPKYPYATESAAAITDISPNPITINVAGGSPVSVTLTGVNLSSGSVTIAYPAAADITETNVVYASDGTSRTMDLDSGGGEHGYFDLTFNGRPFRGVLRLIV